ncbi:hypothetical protein HZB90_02100, partial [archaeon]|nr:hypothetical protein [archaeon]
INCEDRPNKKFLQNDGTFMNTLLTYQVNLYIGGHIHVYVEQETGGVNEMIGGMLDGGRRTLASAGRTQPFTFTVIDVEGDKIDARPIAFKSELGDFDTSELPPAPAVDSPLSAPIPIEQLAAASVCPAGTHPSSEGLGTVAGMNSPAGISLPSAVGALDANTILTQASTKEGSPYGSVTGGYTETSFIVQLLGELGISLSSDDQASVIGVGGSSAENFASALSGVSQSVVLASAQPGDIVYYSWQESGITKDDAGIIESVKGDGKFNIYGAHESLNKVTSLPDVSLSPPVSSVVVRLNPSASAPQTPQAATASPEAQAAPSTPTETPQPSAAASITGCGIRIAAVGDSITTGPSYVKYLRTMCGQDTSIQNDDGDPNTLGARPDTGPNKISPEDWGRGGIWRDKGDKFAFVGKSTGQMLAHFDAVLATGPETVIILGGTNDVTGSWESIKSNLEKMYNAAKAKGMRVVALTVPPYDTAAARAEEERKNGKSPGTIVNNIKQLNNWIMTQSPADIKVNIYDVLLSPTEADSANPALYGGAHLIHPNEEGKRLMAQKVFERLSGAAVPSVPETTTPSTVASPQVPAPTSPITCIPDSGLSQVLYDFIINSTFGSTTIVGIARQNIAIGISKETQQVGGGDVCLPILSKMDYNMDFFRSTYGRIQVEIEPQLVPTQFMGKPVGSIKMPSYFVFTASPSQVTIQQEVSCPQGTVRIFNEDGTASCQPEGLAGTGNAETVIIYGAEGEGSSEFISQARRLSGLFNAKKYPAKNAQDIMDAIKKHGKIGRLILVSHGSRAGWLRPGTSGVRVGPDALPTFVSVDTLAKELAPRLVDGSIISLAACSTASEHGEPPGWEPPLFGPGGANGFAGKLRDALSAQPGIATGIDIRGHTTVGHTTENPAVRHFPVGADKAGKPGISVLDEQWGAGAYKDRSLEWNHFFQGEKAEAWLIGGPASAAQQT